MPFRFFTPETAATFRAAAACIVPADGESEGADAPPFVEAADRALALRPERDRRLLRVFLRAVELLPILFYFRRFSRLDPERQRAFLGKLERSFIGKFRQGFFGLKTFALMGYYASEGSWGSIGYPGPRRDVPEYGRELE